MAKMVQIRDVPEALHRTWRLRAAAQQRSLSAYLLQELRRATASPTMEEWLERVRSRPPVETTADVAAMIREDRKRR
ncbi:MAG: FitA-like ribbon-helix-helix domain-containing protein [Terriglobales bacterium]|jgi:plasmid stability protein